MDITITFEDGPIKAEISAAEDEEYDKVLQDLSDFVENYDGIQNTTVDTGSDETETKEPEEADNEDQGAESDETSDVESGQVTDLTDFSRSSLQRVLKTGRFEDGEVQEHPRIIGDIDTLGETETEKLLHTSIVVLAVMDDFHDTDTMKTSELKQSLADSGLNDDNFGNIDKLDETEVYVTRRGRGPTATTQIRAPGKDEAYRQVKRLIETL